MRSRLGGRPGRRQPAGFPERTLAFPAPALHPGYGTTPSASLLPVSGGIPLQPAFDEALYRWEQSYFAEHFLGSHLGLEPASFLNHPALKEQAQFLAALPECPVHRDSQSQNVHIHAGKTWLIDFQGMRGGRPEYDLASLVYDGYARLEPEQADELLRSGKISPLTP